MVKKKNQNPNKHKPPKQTKTTKQTKNPKDPKPRQYTVQDYVYAGLEKKSVFLMHLWLELVKKTNQKDKSLFSLVITKAYLLLKVVSYKQLQKSKQINYN